MIISYVLKAEFWLPWNASVYRENPFPPEYQNSLEINGRQWKRHIHSHQHSQNNLRWFIYKAIIERFNRWVINITYLLSFTSTNNFILYKIVYVL